MKDLKAKLPGRDFARIHRKYIVRLDRIMAIEGDAALLDGGCEAGSTRVPVRVPIGSSYKSGLLDRLNVVWASEKSLKLCGQRKAAFAAPMPQFTEISNQHPGRRAIFVLAIGCSGYVPLLPIAKFVFIAQKDPRLWYGFFFARATAVSKSEYRSCLVMGKNLAQRM